MDCIRRERRSSLRTGVATCGTVEHASAYLRDRIRSEGGRGSPAQRASAARILPVAGLERRWRCEVCRGWQREADLEEGLELAQPENRRLAGRVPKRRESAGCVGAAWSSSLYQSRARPAMAMSSQIHSTQFISISMHGEFIS